MYIMCKWQEIHTFSMLSFSLLAFNVCVPSKFMLTPVHQYYDVGLLRPSYEDSVYLLGLQVRWGRDKLCIHKDAVLVCFPISETQNSIPTTYRRREFVWVMVLRNLVHSLLVPRQKQCGRRVWWRKLLIVWWPQCRKRRKDPGERCPFQKHTPSGEQPYP